jgi:hypothetical protein
VGFYPTFRKSFHKPHEENALSYWLNAVKWLLSIFALKTFSLTTALYPISWVLMNSLFLLMLHWRRRSLTATAQ